MKKAMIFAAGLGTRLKPLTDTMPKAMVPVCGKPLLYHVLMKLKSAGFTDIVINVHHFADQIVDYVTENQGFGLDVRFSDERDLLRETGGGIRHAAPLLGENEPFMVHNVDIVSDLDFSWFVSQIAPEDTAAMLTSWRETQRYMLFDDCMRVVGWTNIATGEVKTPYKGLDVPKCKKLAFAGMHLMNPGIFDAFRKIDSDPAAYPLYDGDGKVIPSSLEPLGERFSIIDFYLRACREWKIKGAEPSELRLIDVGKLNSLEAAERFVSGL